MFGKELYSSDMSSCQKLPAGLPPPHLMLKLLFSELFSVIFIFIVFLFCLCFAALFVHYLLLLCFVDYCHPALWHSELRAEIFVIKFVLVSPYYSVPASDYESASSASASLQ